VILDYIIILALTTPPPLEGNVPPVAPPPLPRAAKPFAVAATELAIPIPADILFLVIIGADNTGPNNKAVKW